MTETKKLSEEQVRACVMKVVEESHGSYDFLCGKLADYLNEILLASQVAAPSPATEKDARDLALKINWLWCSNTHSNNLSKMEELIRSYATAREQHQDALIAAAYQVASQEAYDWEPSCPPPPEDEAANGQWRIGRAVARDISHSIKSCTPDRARAALEEEVRKARLEVAEWFWSLVRPEYFNTVKREQMEAYIAALRSPGKKDSVEGSVKQV